MTPQEAITNIEQGEIAPVYFLYGSTLPVSNTRESRIGKNSLYFSDDERF